jgi:hypothetical protein
VAVLIGQLAVASTEPRERPRLPTSLNVVYVGGVGITECTADVPEVGPALVNQTRVITHSRKKVINSLSDSAISDTPATAKVIILGAVADLGQWEEETIIELVEARALQCIISYHRHRLCQHKLIIPTTIHS